MANTSDYTPAQIADYKKDLIRYFDERRYGDFVAFMIDIRHFGEGKIADYESETGKTLKKNYQNFTKQAAASIKQYHRTVLRTRLLIANHNSQPPSESMAYIASCAGIRELYPSPHDRKMLYIDTLLRDVTVGIDAYSGKEIAVVQDLLNTLMNSKKDRELLFADLHHTGLLGHFWAYAGNHNSHIKYAPKLVEDWAAQTGLDMDNLLLNMRVPNLDKYRAGQGTSFITADEFMAQYGKDHDSIDADSVIAEKQKFFDEVSAEQLFEGYLHRHNISKNEVEQLINGAIERSNTFMTTIGNPNDLKRFLRDISLQKWSAEIKSMISTLQLAQSKVPSDQNSKDTLGDQANIGEIWRRALTDGSVANYVFENARRNNYIADLYFLSNAEDSAIPAAVAPRLAEWCSNNKIDLKQILSDYKLPAFNSSAPGMTIDQLKESIYSDPIIMGKIASFRPGELHRTLLPEVSNGESPEEVKARVDRNYANPEIQQRFFETFHQKSALGDVFYLAMVKDTFLPEFIADRLIEWCHERGINLKQILTDHIIPASLQAPRAENLDAIIAEKQKYYDDISIKNLVLAYADKYGATPDNIGEILPDGYNSANSSLRNRLRVVLRIEGNQALKTFLSIEIIAMSRVSALKYLSKDAGDERVIKSWREDWENDFSDSVKRNYVFENARINGYLPDLYFLMNAKDSCIPESASDDFVQWCSNNKIDLQQLLLDLELPVYSDVPPGYSIEEPLPEPVTELAPESESDIKIVEVEGRLVEIGSASDMLAVHKGSEEDEPRRVRTRVPHIEWLVKAIKAQTNHVGDITLYRSKDEAAKGEERDFSHQVIEFTTADGRKHQIATNNWYGGGTYIIKPAANIDPHAPRLVHIPDLLGSGKAWPVRCRSEEQYTHAALEICDAQLETLTPYIPRLAWANKALQVTQTCIDILKETGRIIKSTNHEPLQTGPLRGVTTESRMAAAINNNVIDRLNGASLKEFYDLLYEQNPGLRDHLNKTAVPAEKIIRDAVAIIKRDDLVPQKAILDDIQLAGMPGETLSLFFKMPAEGCVTGWRKYVKDSTVAPDSVDAFMLASGLAVKDPRGDLVPNYDHPLLQQG